MKFASTLLWNLTIPSKKLHWMFVKLLVSNFNPVRPFQFFILVRKKNVFKKGKEAKVDGSRKGNTYLHTQNRKTSN